MSLCRAANCFYLETDRNTLERELGRERQGEENQLGRWTPKGHNLCSESGCLGDKNILPAPLAAKSGALLFVCSKLHITEEG